MDDLSAEPDIRNGEGALIGGVRRVGRDGTVRFDHGRWQRPIEWAGERVFVHMHITHRDEWKCR